MEVGLKMWHFKDIRVSSSNEFDPGPRLELFKEFINMSVKQKKMFG